MDKPYFAFFDVDETLINVKSMFSFMRYYLKFISNKKLHVPTIKYYLFQLKSMIAEWTGTSRAIINQQYYMNFAGVNAQHLRYLGRKWWDSISESPHVFKKEVIAELNQHQKNGAEIVLVSGSMPVCIEPLAHELHVKYQLLSQLEVINGYFTGRLIGGANIAYGKRQSIINFIKKYPKKIDLNQCYAYGDHRSDLPMLELVGNPVVVRNDQLLVETALKKSWKII